MSLNNDCAAVLDFGDTLDEFRKINYWYYFATFSLFSTQGFICNNVNLAKRLEITKDQANDIISYLLEIGYLEQEDGRIYSKVLGSSTPTDISSEDLQTYHQRLLTKAKNSLKLPVHEREYSSCILSCAKEDIKEAKRDIREFQQQFARKYNGKLNKDSIYQLSLQFFRLDRDQEIT